MPRDPRYTVPVGGIAADVLPAKLRTAIEGLQQQFPKLGITLFVFDFLNAGGGISYISNAERGDMIRAVREWLRKNDRTN
jgi:hypothetical protein